MSLQVISGCDLRLIGRHFQSENQCYSSDTSKYQRQSNKQLAGKCTDNRPLYDCKCSADVQVSRLQTPQCCCFIGRKKNTKYSKGTFSNDGPVPLLTPKNDKQLKDGWKKQTHTPKTHTSADTHTRTTWCRSINLTWRLIKREEDINSLLTHAVGLNPFYKAPWLNKHTHTYTKCCSFQCYYCTQVQEKSNTSSEETHISKK